MLAVTHFAWDFLPSLDVRFESVISQDHNDKTPKCLTKEHKVAWAAWSERSLAVLIMSGSCPLQYPGSVAISRAVFIAPRETQQTS
jgi:hypothetical protein